MMMRVVVVAPRASFSFSVVFRVVAAEAGAKDGCNTLKPKTSSSII